MCFTLILSKYFENNISNVIMTEPAQTPGVILRL